MVRFGRLAALCCTISLYVAAPQQRAASIEGVVIDTLGAPIAGANLQLRSADGLLIRTATADGEGRFALPKVPAGRVELTASFLGFRVRKLQVDLTGGEQIRLWVGLQVGHLVDLPIKQLSGIVRRQDGHPIPNAVASIRPDFTVQDVISAISDKTGRYMLELTDSGQYTLTVSASGFLSVSVTVAVPGSVSRTKRSLDFVLLPSSR
jgi:hypothetical protein